MKAVLSLIIAGATVLGAQAQTPLLNSNSAAQATAYLDFDGHTVTGTIWNWSGTIQALPSGLSASAITEIFNRVAEDYRIFNINITTDSTVYHAAPYNKRVRIIVTPTYEWYGKSGGAALVGSFADGDDLPAFVFSGLLGNNVKNVAEAISHETGHTLGLQHQSSYDASCAMTAEYAGGKGSGQIGWAPIMGVGYYKNLTTWHNGTNAEGCHVLQDDISIIAGPANGFGMRADDHPNIAASATPLTRAGTEFQATGLVNSNTDKDVFQFTLPTAANFRINANPNSIGPDNAGANLDIRVRLLNQQGDTIGQYNPATLLNAGLDSNLNGGTYYLVVDGVGNINHDAYASLGYYSISGSIGQVLPVHRFVLSATRQNERHLLQWQYEADEPIQEIRVEYSTDGQHFQPLVQLSAESRSFTWKATMDNTLYYRAKAITLADERAYYSNIVSLKTSDQKGFRLLSNLVTQTIGLHTSTDYSYQLFDETGRLLQRGQLAAGVHQLPVPQAPAGLLLLRLQNDTGSWSEKLIKH